MKAALFHSRSALASLSLALLVSPLTAAAESGMASADEFPDTTLAGIYELALEQDFTLAQARAQYRVGKEERKLALSGLLPSLNASYSKSETDSSSSGTSVFGSITFPNTSDSEADSDSWNVSLSQPLFDLPAWFQFKRGAELSKQAESSFALAQQNLVVRTVTAYFAVLRAAANLRASTAQEEALKAQLDQVRQRFDVGLVAITDVLEAEAGYDLAVARRIADEGNLDISREQLSLLTGRPHRDLWRLKADFPVNNPDPVSPEEWVKFSFEHNLDIKVALYGRQASEYAMRTAKSQFLPRATLSVVHSDSSRDTTVFDLTTDPSDPEYRSDSSSDSEQDAISINLSVPIYTGGAISANRRQAVARYETQTALFEGTVRQVTQETRALFSQVVSDVSRSRARARAVDSTKSALEAAEIGYEVGTRNVVDVLNAQQAFFSATRDYDTSILDYVINLVQLKRRAGTLSPQDIYDLNKWLVASEETAAE